MLAACSSSLSPVNPPSFVRPERVAFACVRTGKSGAQLPVPLEQCSPCKGHTDVHALTAFVTQTTRGELAAVNLQTSQVIDTQRTVPGFTFVPVGESPIAVVVPTQQPEHTYVAHAGSSDLRVLDTASLLGTTGIQSATLAAIPLGQMVDGQWQEAEPTDMVISADEQRLVFAAPRLHGLIVVALVDVERVIAGEMDPASVTQTLIPLSGLASAATVTTATGSDRYSVTCQIHPAQPSQAVAPFEQTATISDAEPVALAVDADNNRVLVADAALPIIHAIDLSTLTEVRDGDRPLFVTGVPTLDVAVSPAVPVSPDDVVTEQYIYAIDADQRDVLVINERGVMQSVNAPGRARADRLDLGGSAALSIEVIEPGYRGCAQNPVVRGPRVLRGVFLATSMIDGTIRITDIYDLDASDRCTPVASEKPEACTETAPCAAIQRHRPRIASSFVSADPCVAPKLTDAKTANFTLTTGALTDDATVPNLTPLAACSGNQTAAYQEVTLAPNEGTTGMRSVTAECADETPPTPDDGFTESRAPLVCVNSDPWSASAEVWTVEWEGLVPRAVGSGALTDTEFDAEGALTKATLTTDAFAFDFCAAGTEGNQKYAVELGITATDEQLIDAFDDLTNIDCAAFTSVQADGYRPRLAIEIGEARPGVLTLGGIVHRPSAFADDTDAELIEKARHCVAGQRFEFGVRSLNRYTVVGARTGFVHNVENVGGVCVSTSVEGEVLSAGQAVAGVRYENAHIAFQINHRPPVPAGGTASELAPTQGFTFSFAPASVTDYVGFNAMNTGRGLTPTLVSELRYSPTDARLYAVDSALRGLMPIPLSPMPSNLSNSHVFQ